MKYYIIEKRNVGTMGNPSILTTIVSVHEDKIEALNQCEDLRKTYKDKTIVDCYVLSEEDIKKIEKAKERYESLTEIEKQDVVEVDGRKYVRALYEMNKKVY